MYIRAENNNLSDYFILIKSIKVKTSKKTMKRTQRKQLGFGPWSVAADSRGRTRSSTPTFRPDSNFILIFRAKPLYLYKISPICVF